MTRRFRFLNTVFIILIWGELTKVGIQFAGGDSGRGMGLVCDMKAVNVREKKKTLETRGVYAREA